MILGQGKCSTFGGPNDFGVGISEGLSCIDPSDLMDWWFSRIFLANQPINTTGLARKLNPQAFYIAMRWGYGSFEGVQGEILPDFTRDQVRNAMFRLTANGNTVYAQAADWGPNTDTGRLVDCSPGVLSRLNLQTDQLVAVELV
jgi:hypothetical protein